MVALDGRVYVTPAAGWAETGAGTTSWRFTTAATAGAAVATQAIPAAVAATTAEASRAGRCTASSSETVKFPVNLTASYVSLSRAHPHRRSDASRSAPSVA